MQLSPQEREKAKIKKAHISEIRSVFRAIGFERASEVSGKELNYLGTTSDFDDVFLFENVLALVEYTTSQESDISSHLKKKKVLYDKILSQPEAFVSFLDNTSPEFAARRGTLYPLSHIKIEIIYCSRNLVKASLKAEVPTIKYLDFHIAKYFKSVTSIVKRSARFEFFKFLGLSHDTVGAGAISTSSAASANYKGSILPEAHSKFKRGYKVVSFYVDPDALLSRCYVLRKDGWGDSGNLYQRMISKKKIEAIRKYLVHEKRVFINNIIVTLPSNTKLLDTNGNTQDASTITHTVPVEIQLPSEFNSVGLIDGQHRVFSYYEGDGQTEAEIKKLRTQQNLLVTGIIYPPGIHLTEKTKFEANLFLEINATQTNAKSDIKQAIGLLLRPFSSESIAKDIVNHLNNDGPLSDKFERYFFDKKKLKTTSVVSYGIRPLVKLQGSDTLFSAWKRQDKDKLLTEDVALRAAYIDFCVEQINIFIGAVRANLPSDRWTSDKEVPKRLLTTTNINGFIVCLRKILQTGKLRRFDFYKNKLTNLSKFNFGEYRSSQYGRMGDDLYNKYFQ